jgi:hypothetical protein
MLKKRDVPIIILMMIKIDQSDAYFKSKIEAYFCSLDATWSAYCLLCRGVQDFVWRTFWTSAMQ